MSTLDYWTVHVKEVFDIRGRGRIAYGTWGGVVPPKVGDLFEGPNGDVLTVRGVEMAYKAFGPMRDVGVIIPDGTEVKVGMTLRQVDPEDV